MTPRWHAVASYRTDTGLIDVAHDFEEIGDLAEIIERGPNFGCIEQIVITYTGVAPRITVEQAEKM